MLFIYGSPSIRNPYASKTSTLNKEELVFDKEKVYFQHFEIILPKIKENWSLRERYATLTVVLPFSSSPSFSDLSIEEVTNTQQLDSFFFLQVYITLLMPRRIDEPGTDMCHPKPLDIENNKPHTTQALSRIHGNRL